jgi:hypothetical protein
MKKEIVFVKRSLLADILWEGALKTSVFWVALGAYGGYLIVV